MTGELEHFPKRWSRRTCGREVRAMTDLIGSQGTSGVIPEPSSVTLLAIGIAGLLGHGWRRHREFCSSRARFALSPDDRRS